MPISVNHRLSHSSLLLLANQLIGKVATLAGTIFSAIYVLIFFQRNLKLLYNWFIHKNFLSKLEFISLQVSDNCLGFNDASILAKSIIATKHIREHLVFVINCSWLALMHDYHILIGIGLDLTSNLFGESPDDFADLLTIIHNNSMRDLVYQHRVTCDE